MTFPFRTAPFSHQREEFESHRDDEYRALWWEPGCGKTKPIIDTAAHLFRTGQARNVLVLAPDTVHTQWTRDEAPAHLIDELRPTARAFAWSTQRSTTKRFRRDFEDFLAYGRGLRFLAMSYDSLMTDRGAQAAKAFLTSAQSMLVLDESHRIKTPGAKRTKRVLALSRYAPRFRRVLTGTPITNRPFDLYTQCKFLDPQVWSRRGIRGAVAFRNHFGVWAQRSAGPNRTYPKLLFYQNLDELGEVATSMGRRLLKADVLDLPPQLYERRLFRLAPDQRRMYDELASEYRAWFGDGSTVTAAEAIVRRTRLQQVCSGYLPADMEAQLRPLVPREKNPRLRAFLDLVEDTPGQATLWGKYDVDVDGMCWALDQLRPEPGYVRFDGRTKPAERVRAVDSFRKGLVQFFVGKASAAGTGLNLQVASTGAFYNNTDDLGERVQAENRIHRPGMPDAPATYFDLVGEDTVDEDIVRNLRDKFDTAACVMGDQLRPWI